MTPRAYAFLLFFLVVILVIVVLMALSWSGGLGGLPPRG